MKKIITLSLALAMALSLCVPALATEEVAAVELTEAEVVEALAEAIVEAVAAEEELIAGVPLTLLDADFAWMNGMIYSDNLPMEYPAMITVDGIDTYLPWIWVEDEMGNLEVEYILTTGVLAAAQRANLFVGAGMPVSCMEIDYADQHFAYQLLGDVWYCDDVEGGYSEASVGQYNVGGNIFVYPSGHGFELMTVGTMFYLNVDGMDYMIEIVDQYSTVSAHTSF